jgi:hypothetical protein
MRIGTSPTFFLTSWRDCAFSLRPKGRGMRTDANLNALCEALTANCGDLWDACLRVGLSLQFVSQWQADDPAADVRLSEATRFGAMRIQSAMIRRGVDGIMQPVFYQGEVCGYKAEYSDGLLNTLARGRLPHLFAPDSEGSRQVFNGPVQINNMPRAETYEDWLAMKTATLAARDDHNVRALPPPALEIQSPPQYQHAFAGVDL